MKYLSVALLSILLFGCVSKNTSDAGIKPLVVFDNKDDSWGGDIRLSLVSVTDIDTARIYKAVSSSDQGNIGLLVIVSKKQVDSNGFGNAITLKSLGKTSDLLLQKLAQLYKQSISANSKFKERVQASFVDLGEFAKKIDGATDKSIGGVAVGGENVKQYKLFFETKNDEAELFLNINIDDMWLELREKDEDYRPVLIKAFTQ